MPQHYTNELIFDLPDQLIDTTHHIFSLSKDGPSEFNMVISQHQVGLEDQLQDYIKKQLDELRKALPDFELQSHGEMPVAGQNALWMVFSWIQQGRKLNQAQVCFLYDKGPEQRHLIQITATALNSFSTEWRQTFETFLASVKLRQEPVKQAITNHGGAGTCPTPQE